MIFYSSNRHQRNSQWTINMILLLLACITLCVIHKGAIDCNAFQLTTRLSQVRSTIHWTSRRPPPTRRNILLSSTSSDNNSNNNNNEGTDGRIDVLLDERLYRVRLSRATGIEWGTDLSFSFVYVRDLDPTGDAALSGTVKKGDQLCEMIPVAPSNGIIDVKPVNMLGASFDFVMTALASLDRTVSQLDLVFFRGTKEELKAACTGDPVKTETDMITVTVIQNKGSPQEALTTLQAPAGVNVRQLLVDNGINVYQSVTRWTNCKGKQLCGTCIVNIADGGTNTNWKSMDEASTLRTNPDSYRLSCVTFAHGDVTVETFPPVNKDQWTR
jgi:ferredoxin